MLRRAANCCVGSGVLFAWAAVPRLARAEGRDPRFLTIVLRGGLDGLAVVAPVGDPDWVKLRGDKWLTVGGPDPGIAARRLLRAEPGDAEPASPLSGGPGDGRARGRDTLSRALAFRRAGRAGKRAAEAGRRRYRLAQPRAHGGGARRPSRPARPAGLCGRADHAARRARAGAGAVLGAAAAAAGQRRYDDASPRPLPPYRSDLCARARGAHRARGDRPAPAA